MVTSGDAVVTEIILEKKELKGKAENTLSFKTTRLLNACQSSQSYRFCEQMLVEPKLGRGSRLRSLSQQHLVRVWQQDAAERHTGR